MYRRDLSSCDSVESEVSDCGGSTGYDDVFSDFHDRETVILSDDLEELNYIPLDEYKGSDPAEPLPIEGYEHFAGCDDGPIPWEKSDSLMDCSEDCDLLVIEDEGTSEGILLNSTYGGEFEDNFDLELEFAVDLYLRDGVLPDLYPSSEDPAN